MFAVVLYMSQILSGLVFRNSKTALGTSSSQPLSFQPVADTTQFFSLQPVEDTAQIMSLLCQQWTQLVYATQFNPIQSEMGTTQFLLVSHRRHNSVYVTTVSGGYNPVYIISSRRGRNPIYVASDSGGSNSDSINFTIGGLNTVDEIPFVRITLLAMSYKSVEDKLSLYHCNQRRKQSSIVFGWNEDTTYTNIISWGHSKVHVSPGSLKDTAQIMCFSKSLIMNPTTYGLVT